MTTLEQINQDDRKLELALNSKGRKFSVQLSNVGNPDYRQDSGRPLPETVCGWAQVDTLKEASELCRLYISFYELGGGNWNGGLITQNDNGLVVGHVSYNGRVWEGATWTRGAKPIFDLSAAD